MSIAKTTTYTTNKNSPKLSKQKAREELFANANIHHQMPQYKQTEHDETSYDAMSKNKYRKTYMSDTKYAEGYDVGHIIAQNNGGADAAQNFQAEPSVLNKALKHFHDDIHIAMLPKNAGDHAIRVSRENGKYNGPDGDEMRRTGKKKLEFAGLKLNTDGSWDTSSEAFRNGDAFLKKNGDVDGRSRTIKRIQNTLDVYNTKQEDSDDDNDDSDDEYCSFQQALANTLHCLKMLLGAVRRNGT